MSHGFHFGSSCKTFPDNNTAAGFGVLHKNRVSQSPSPSSQVIVHRQQKIFDRLTRRVILVSSKLLPPLELSPSPSPIFVSQPQPPLSSLNSNSQSHIHSQSKSQSQPQHQSQPQPQSKPLLPQSSLARRLTIKTTNKSKQTAMNKNTNRQKHQHLQKQQQFQPSQQPPPQEMMLQQQDIKRQQQTDSMMKRRVPTPIRRNYHNDKSINNNVNDTNNTDNNNNDGGDQDRKGKFFPSTTPQDQLSSSSSIKLLTTTSTVVLKPNLTRSLKAITVSSKTLRHANNKRSISLSKIHEHKITQQDSYDDNDKQMRLKKLRRMRLLRERQMMAMMGEKEKGTVDVPIEKDERKGKLEGEEEIEDRRKQHINNDKSKKELVGNYVATSKFVKKKEIAVMKENRSTILDNHEVLSKEETIESSTMGAIVSSKMPPSKYFSNPNPIPPPSITAATIPTIDNVPFNNKHDIIRKDNNSINDININSPRSLYDNSSDYGLKTNIPDITKKNENLKSSTFRTSSNDQRKVKGNEVIEDKEHANTRKEYLQQTRRRRQQIQEERRHKQQQQQQQYQHQELLQQQWRSSKKQKQQISTSQTILDIDGTTIVSVDSFATSTAMMYDVNTGDECKTEIEPSSRLLTPPSTLTLLLVPPTPSPPLTNVTSLCRGSSMGKVDRRYVNDHNDNDNDDNDGLNSNIQKIDEGNSKDTAKTRKVGVNTQHGIGGVVKGMERDTVVTALIGKKNGAITRNIETFRDRRPDSREGQDWEAKLESHEQNTTKLPRQLNDEIEVPSQHLPWRNESAKLILKEIVLSSVEEEVIRESSKCDIDVGESDDDKNQTLIQKQLAMERTKAMAMEILGRFGKLGKYRKVIEKNKKKGKDKKDVDSLTIKEGTTFNLQDRAWLNKGECSQRLSYVSPPSPSKITMIMNTTFSGSSQILTSHPNLEENKCSTHDDKLDTTLMSSGLENHKNRTKLNQKLKETKSKLRHEQMLSLNPITEQEQRKGLENDTTNSPSLSYTRDLDFHDNHSCNNLTTLLPPNKKCNVGSDRFIDRGSTSEKESHGSIIRKVRKGKNEFMISSQSTKALIQKSNPLEVDHFPTYLSPQTSNGTMLSSKESIQDDCTAFDDNTDKNRNQKEVTLAYDERNKLAEPEEFKELLIHAQKSYPLDYLLVDSSSMWSSNSGKLPDCSIGLLPNNSSQEFLLHSPSTPTVTTSLSCNKIKSDPILATNIKGKDVSCEKKNRSMYSENNWYASLPILPFKFDPNDKTFSCKSLNSVLINGEVSTILKYSTAKEDLPVYEYLWKDKSDEKECIIDSKMVISQNDINCNIVSQLTEERRRERSLENALYEYDDSFLSRNIMEKVVLNESSMEKWETEATERVLNARTNLQHLSIFSKQ